MSERCSLCKRPSQIRSDRTWGLRRGNPQVRSTLFGFVFEWAERVGGGCEEPNISFSVVWLLGWLPTFCSVSNDVPHLNSESGLT